MSNYLDDLEYERRIIEGLNDFQQEMDLKKYEE